MRGVPCFVDVSLINAQGCGSHVVLVFFQEVWLGNDELVNMYEKRLGDANYTLFKLARTNNRGDGEFSLFTHFSLAR